MEIEINGHGFLDFEPGNKLTQFWFLYNKFRFILLKNITVQSYQQQLRSSEILTPVDLKNLKRMSLKLTTPENTKNTSLEQSEHFEHRKPKKCVITALKCTDNLHSTCTHIERENKKLNWNRWGARWKGERRWTKCEIKWIHYTHKPTLTIDTRHWKTWKQLQIYFIKTWASAKSGEDKTAVEEGTTFNFDEKGWVWEIYKI